MRIVRIHARKTFTKLLAYVHISTYADMLVYDTIPTFSYHHLPQIVKGCEKRKHFFTNRVANPWNILPQIAINAATLNVFKDQLTLHG